MISTGRGPLPYTCMKIVAPCTDAPRSTMRGRSTRWGGGFIRQSSTALVRCDCAQPTSASITTLLKYQNRMPIHLRHAQICPACKELERYVVATERVIHAPGFLRQFQRQRNINNRHDVLDNVQFLRPPLWTILKQVHDGALALPRDRR